MLGTKRILDKVIGVAVITSIGVMLAPTVAQAAPKRKLTIADAAVIEGDAGTATLTFRIVYTGKPTGGIAVDYATAAGSATAGTDYTSASGTAPLPSGGCKCVDVTVDALADLDEEANETLLVSLSDPAIATISDGSATGTIYDDDGPPAIVVLDAVADEAAGSAFFDVALTSSDIDTVTVDYATANGTALAGGDYASTSGTVTFAPGDTLETVDVPVLDDGVAEEEESFTLQLSNPAEATIDRSVAVGSIVDTDADPTLTVGDASVAEGDETDDRHPHGVPVRAERKDGRGRLRDERCGRDRCDRLRLDDRHPHVRPGRHRGTDRRDCHRRCRRRGRRGGGHGPVR